MAQRKKGTQADQRHEVILKLAEYMAAFHIPLKGSTQVFPSSPGVFPTSGNENVAIA